LKSRADSGLCPKRNTTKELPRLLKDCRDWPNARKAKREKARITRTTRITMAKKTFLPFFSESKRSPKAGK
jgi:hypothetical protein